MTDDHTPIDDEIVSAVLDGEATPGERALVEGSVEGRRRLEELRAVAASMAEPPPPLTEPSREALIARALDRAHADAAAAPVTTSDELAARRSRPPVWRRVGAVAAAVVVAIALVGGIAALARSTGHSSSSDSASSATADTVAVGEKAAGGSDSAASSAAPTPPDLGILPDATAVLDQYAALVSASPAFDHQFDARATAESPTRNADAAADAGVRPACPVPPGPVQPSETWTVVGVAQLPGGPVLVLDNGVASPGDRVLVVDSTTCAVLAERTT